MIVISSRFPLTLVVVVACIVLQIYAAQAREYHLAPEPDWVLSTRLPDKAWAENADHADGVAYLLVDRQYLVDEGGQKQFAHFAEEAVNPSGVENISHISIEFDPLYEKLTLHKLLIHRNGEIIDYLNRAKLDVIQRETGLDSQIYDGEKTLNIFIEDVRVGDIVEHSYTLDGANPAFADHFAQSLAVRWAVPVGKVHYSVLWSRTRTLNFKTVNSDLKPQIESRQGITRYRWQQDEVEGLVLGETSAAPDWYQPYGRLYLSDYASWSEVSKWGWPLYRQGPASGPLKEIAHSLSKDNSSEEDRILAVLRFVQDEIRYLGMEMGEQSFKPTSPEQLITQRFGDCKGKATLMVELLREMGIAAKPALVHSSKGKNIVNLLPTPKAFNHVIVHLESGGNQYWLDPTLSYQRGNLGAVYQPDYGYAVKISADGFDLEKMFAGGSPLNKKEVSEYFDLSGDGGDGKVKYTIRTLHERRFADRIRRTLSESSRRETERSYLDYTAQYYPDIEQTQELQVIDDERNNRVTEVEHYQIADIWERQEGETYEYAGFEPYLLYNYLDKETAVRRVAPLGLAHPVLIKQTTRIKTPKGFVFENEHQEVTDKAFRFSYDVHFEQGVLVLEYSYQSLRDYVLPEELKQYAEHLNQAYDTLGYWLQQPNRDGSSTDFSLNTSDLNIGLLVIVYSSVLLVCGVMWWLIFYHNPELRLEAVGGRIVTGLRGWLILPGVALAICPVMVFWLNWEAGILFSRSHWSLIGQQFGSSMQLLIAVETICLVFMALFPLGLLVLYFGKRHTFPKLTLIYLMVWQAYAITDGVAIWLFDLTDPETVRLGVQQFIGVTLLVVLLGAYLCRSKQVKATFCERLVPFSGRVAGRTACVAVCQKMDETAVEKLRN